ncbi:MAG TPA: hypothetical protein VIT45_07500 [Allosphingosinicella sp.]
MKRIAIAALIAAQTMAPPAFAADFGDQPADSAQRQGAFAGARLRVPLGGEAGGKARAGLAVAPLLQGRRADGSVRTRFGEGLEFGFAGGKKAELSLAGRPVKQLAQGRTGPDGRKLGVSTVGWVAIGVGIAAIAGVAWFVNEMNEPHD